MGGGEGEEPFQTVTDITPGKAGGNQIPHAFQDLIFLRHKHVERGITYS